MEHFAERFCKQGWRPSPGITHSFEDPYRILANDGTGVAEVSQCPCHLLTWLAAKRVKGNKERIIASTLRQAPKALAIGCDALLEDRHGLFDIIRVRLLNQLPG